MTSMPITASIATADPPTEQIVHPSWCDRSTCQADSPGARGRVHYGATEAVSLFSRDLWHDYEEDRWMPHRLTVELWQNVGAARPTAVLHDQDPDYEIRLSMSELRQLWDGIGHILGAAERG